MNGPIGGDGYLRLHLPAGFSFALGLRLASGQHDAQQTHEDALLHDDPFPNEFWSAVLRREL